MTGDQVGRQVVDFFMYFLREVIGDQDVYTLAAMDLSQAAGVISALEQFTTAANANPEAALSPIADARNNVISYGGFNDPQLQDIFSSVDLYSLAELTSSISTDPTPPGCRPGRDGCRQVLVIYEDHVEALNGTNGLSIFFPAHVQAFQSCRIQ